MVGHIVMVGIMTMLPLHMRAGGHELQVIGSMISLHIIGMYAFSPIVGKLVDRLGPQRMIVVGSLLLTVGSVVAARNEAHQSLGAFVGMFLIGIGWSCGLVASSALLAVTFDGPDRVRVQGLADLSMTTAGALAGVSAGLVVAATSYQTLGDIASIVGLLPILGFVALMISQRKAASAA